MTDVLTLVIRGGIVVDGTGRTPFEADVGISGGRITAVGRVAGTRHEEIDARGLLVTPGFVDFTRITTRRPPGRATSRPVLERRYHRADRQLRRRLRALQARPARHAGETDGRRGGHPRSRADRGPPVELGELPEFLDRAGRAPLRHGRGDAGAARGAARVRDGRARRRARTGDRSRIVPRWRGWRPRASGPARSASPPRARINHKTWPASRRRRWTPPRRNWPRSPRRSAQSGAGWMQVITDFDDPRRGVRDAPPPRRRLWPTDDDFRAGTRLASPGEWRHLLGKIEAANAERCP